MEPKVNEEGKQVETKELDIKSLFADPPQETPGQTDEKAEKTPSSGEPEDEKPEELQAKVDALTKELNRVRKGKADSSAEVQELRERLANMQGQLETLSKGTASTGSDENRLAKYTDEQLLQGQTEWEDTLYDERDAMRRARSDNDEAAYAKASRNASTAKTTLNSIRKELLERTKRVGAEQAKAQTEASELVNEIAGLYESTYDAYPGLKDKDSEIWQAGNAIFNQHPKLMKQLGPLAELVATALAITENPKLVPGEGTSGEKKARKELLNEINERAEQSLIKGRGTPSKKTVPDFAAMPTQEFDGLIHKLKMGG